MPMIPEIKEKWIAGLRNPDAEQGIDILRDSEGNQCCLDILNQQCSDDGYQPQPVFRPEYGNWGYEDPDCDPDALEGGLQVTSLTQATQKYAGLDECDPRVRWGSGKYHLSYLNDMIRLDFLRIADAIEEDDEL